MIKLNGNTTYTGATLDDREENGRDDSDFYAVVWDEDAGEVRRVDYNSTRHAGGGFCKVDATPDVIAKATRWLAGWAVPQIAKLAEEKATEIKMGSTVTVVRGRKVPHGTTGEVFYLKPKGYGNKVVVRVGIRTGEAYEDVAWTYLTNLEVVAPELPTHREVLRRAIRFARRSAETRSWGAPFTRCRVYA